MNEPDQTRRSLGNVDASTYVVQRSLSLQEDTIILLHIGPQMRPCGIVAP